MTQQGTHNLHAIFTAPARTFTRSSCGASYAPRDPSGASAAMRKRTLIRSDDAWQFVAAIAELPADDWLDAATSACSSKEESLAADVRRLISESGAALTAWLLTDAIDTVAWYCRRTQVSRRNGRHQAQIDLAIAAARRATLAILVRPSLGEERFSVLYAPFTRIPIDPPVGGEASREVFMGSLCAGRRGRANVQGT